MNENKKKLMKELNLFRKYNGPFREKLSNHYNAMFDNSRKSYLYNTGILEAKLKDYIRGEK